MVSSVPWRILMCSRMETQETLINMVHDMRNCYALIN